MSYRLQPGQVPRIISWNEKDRDQVQATKSYNQLAEEMGWMVGDDYSLYLEISRLYNYTLQVQELWNENLKQS